MRREKQVIKFTASEILRRKVIKRLDAEIRSTSVLYAQKATMSMKKVLGEIRGLLALEKGKI